MNRLLTEFGKERHMQYLKDCAHAEGKAEALASAYNCEKSYHILDEEPHRR